MDEQARYVPGVRSIIAMGATGAIWMWAVYMSEVQV